MNSRCSRLGICSLSYLWRRDQKELLQEMIDCNIEAIVIKVAALGLDPTKHLGLRIDKLMPHLVKMVKRNNLLFSTYLYLDIYVYSIFNCMINMLLH